MLRVGTTDAAVVAVQHQAVRSRLRDSSGIVRPCYDVRIVVNCPRGIAMKVVFALLGALLLLAAALLLMTSGSHAQQGKGGTQPKGCIRCEDLCVRCSEKLRAETGGKSHICRGSCRDWASTQGVKQIWVRPDMSLCAVKGGSFAAARCQ
jgi:hypothetical protein